MKTSLFLTRSIGVSSIIWIYSNILVPIISCPFEPNHSIICGVARKILCLSLIICSGALIRFGILQSFFLYR